jgi:hypothetical protein
LSCLVLSSFDLLALSRYSLAMSCLVLSYLILSWFISPCVFYSRLPFLVLFSPFVSCLFLVYLLLCLLSCLRLSPLLRFLSFIFFGFFIISFLFLCHKATFNLSPTHMASHHCLCFLLRYGLRVCLAIALSCRSCLVVLSYGCLVFFYDYLSFLALSLPSPFFILSCLELFDYACLISSCLLPFALSCLSL